MKISSAGTFEKFICWNILNSKVSRRFTKFHEFFLKFELSFGICWLGVGVQIIISSCICGQWFTAHVRSFDFESQGVDGFREVIASSAMWTRLIAIATGLTKWRNQTVVHKKVTSSYCVPSPSSISCMNNLHNCSGIKSFNSIPLKIIIFSHASVALSLAEGAFCE